MSGLATADLRARAGLSLLRGLSFLDRFLAFFVLLAMILGVIIGAWRWSSQAEDQQLT